MENQLKETELRIGNVLSDEFGFSTYVVESINSKGINLHIADDGNWAELAQNWIEPEISFDKILYLLWKIIFVMEIIIFVMEKNYYICYGKLLYLLFTRYPPHRRYSFEVGF